MLKKLKMIFFIIISILAVIIVIAAIFINTSPEFGGEHGDERIARYSETENFKEGIFHNEHETKMDMGFFKFMSILKDYIVGVPNASPDNKIEAIPLDSVDVEKSQKLTKVTWLGHSAFMLEIEEMNILIDPMLGDVPSPHPMLGRSRFSELPISMDKIPAIDFVLISHDHYDHLDYGSIKTLKDRVKKFFVPMGVGAHLEAWGVDTEKIEELAWWEETNFRNVKLVFAPARHFSGRGLSNRFSTLWGSWIINADSANIYFSGDSGYDDHFKRIGDKYGPFDFAMMECGQYDERWDEIHMFPEETAQAAKDLRADVFMPIHWGSFVLALHSWTDPIERVTKKADELNIKIATPKIGEPIFIDSKTSIPQTVWWGANEN